MAGLSYIAPAAYLATAAQTINKDVAYLAKLGYQPPAALLGKLVWNLPAGQMSDSRTRMPAVAQKSEDLSTYFGFDDRLLASPANVLRMVPGRYGITSAIKLEGAPTGLLTAQGFTDGAALPEPWTACDDGTRLTVSVSLGICDLQTTVGDTPEGLCHVQALGNTRFGKTYSVTVAARVRSGAMDATRVLVRGYDANDALAYEVAWPLVKTGHRWVATGTTPLLTDLGNLPGYETVALETLTLQTEFAATAAVRADVYGLQVEAGFPTSLNLPTARGYDQFKYSLPSDAPESLTLAFWATMPRQVSGTNVLLFGEPSAAFLLGRADTLAANDPTLVGQARYLDGSTCDVLLTPTTSVLDELPHHWVVGFGYAPDGAPRLYVTIDGVDYGTATDETERACFLGAPGATWDLSGILHFADGSTYVELENPALFAGVLSADDAQILYHTTVPIQTSSVPGALTSSGVGPWHVFAITPGQTTIPTNVTGQRLLDLLVDEVPQYADDNFTYDPVTGVVDFADPGLTDPGPIDGSTARVRFAAQAFTGGDADSLGGRLPISADDPAIGTVAGANRVVVTNQFGLLPVVMGVPTNLFVRTAALGTTIATLAGGKLHPTQRPVATAQDLGMVMTGAGLAIDGQGRLGINFEPLLASALNAPNGVPKLVDGQIQSSQLPMATADRAGIVKVVEANGLDVDPDGFLRLTIDPVAKSQIGPPTGGNYVADRLATLQQVNAAYILHAGQRPIARHANDAGDATDKRGCVIPGVTLSVTAEGLINLESTLVGAYNNALGLGLAKLAADGKLHSDNRPIATTGALGTVRVGTGLAVTDAGELSVGLGKGLVTLDNKLTLALAPAGALVLNENDELALAEAVVPASALTTPLTSATKLAELESGEGVPAVLKADQRPVAGQVATLADLANVTTTTAARGTVYLPPGAWSSAVASKVTTVNALAVASDGMLGVKVAVLPSNGGQFGTPGVVYLGDPEVTFLDVAWVPVPGSTDQVPVLVARERPSSDFAAFNDRQERNFMAAMVGKWVTYVAQLGDSMDRGAYVIGAEKVGAEWQLRLSANDTLISYKQLTAVPPTLGRGYIVSGGNTDIATGVALDRITSLGTAVSFSVALSNAFRTGMCAAGFTNGCAYFFGGWVTTGNEYARVVKLSAEEVADQIVATTAEPNMYRAAAAATPSEVYVTGGWQGNPGAGAGATCTAFIRRLDPALDTLAKLENIALLDADATFAPSAEHVGLGFSIGAFFLTGAAKADGTELRNGRTVNLITPSPETLCLRLKIQLGFTGAVLENQTPPAMAFQTRRAAAGAVLNGFGYLAGGWPIGSTAVERLDPTSLVNHYTGAYLDTTANVGDMAVVSTGDKLFFSYTEVDSATQTVLASARNVMDQMDHHEIVTRCGISLSSLTRWVNPAAASVAF